VLIQVKKGFGGFMGAFFSTLVPTTPGVQKLMARPLKTAINWAPSRMVDAAEEMLAAWQKNDTDSAPTTPPEIPIILVAMARDYIPAGRDFTRQIADSVPVMIPGDAKERIFGMRIVAADIRAQVAIFAHDAGTATSLAAQFALFLDSTAGRRFSASFTYAGASHDWPVQVESPDVPFSNIATENKNLTILVGDLTLKASIPFFDAPKAGDANDGQGTPGSATDPAGYPFVTEVEQISRGAIYAVDQDGGEDDPIGTWNINGSGVQRQ